MPFPPNVKEDALVACGRHCCLCRKFCGTKIEVHHIREESTGGDNSPDNAIPVCFDCHADMRSYDSKHPIGNKYSVSELKRHRDEWYKTWSNTRSNLETELPELPKRFPGGFETLEIDTKSRSELGELQKVFPGGFEPFGVLIDGSATAGHKTVRCSTSDSIDVTWGNAAITEQTPGNVTLRLQNLRIRRTEMTPGGTQPAGEVNINGAAVWRIDRGDKRVYINNAINFWGYVLGGVVISAHPVLAWVDIDLEAKPEDREVRLSPWGCQRERKRPGSSPSLSRCIPMDIGTGSALGSHACVALSSALART